MELFNIVAQPNRDLMKSERDSIMDTDWLKDTFLMTEDVNGAYSSWLEANKYVSSADYQYGSTAVGMSAAVNSPPSFTRYCDIRRPGKIKSRDRYDMRKTGVPGYTVGSGGHPYGWGFGRYYCEAIHDNQQRVFMKFGEPQHMNMLTWIGKSFDINKAILYKRGFISTTLLQLVNLGTKLMAVSFAPLIFAGKILLEAMIQPSKFISIKENMYTYWTMVETLLNSMYVRRTKVPYMYEDFTKGLDNMIGQTQTVTRNFIEGLNQLIPGVVDPKTGRISVWTIALRFQAAYNKMMWDDLDRLETNNVGYAYEDYQIRDKPHDTYFTNRSNSTVGFTSWLMNKAFETINKEGAKGDSAGMDLTNMAAKMFGGEADMRHVDGEEDLPHLPSMNEIVVAPDGGLIQPELNTRDYRLSADGKMEQNETNPAKIEKFNRYGEYLQALMTNGGGFAVFAVDSTGSVGESFTNTSETNPLETLYNSISSKVRTATNALGGIGEIPFVGDMLKTGMDAVAIGVSNLSFGLANPLLGLLYGTQVSLPKSWSGSNANFPTASYTFRASTPYNNAYSQLFNMYLPISMAMVAGLPRSTGLDTFTSCFMIQLFDKGRVNIPYGMVDSLSIVRGVSNLAFTRSGHVNAIDVSMNISDLNQVMALDISSSGIMTRFMQQLSPRFGDTNAQNYVNTLTGLDPFTMYYKEPMLRLKIAERDMTLRAFRTDQAASAASLVDNLPSIGIIKSFFGNDGSLMQDMRM